MDENCYANESRLPHVLARIQQQDYRGALQLLQNSSTQATTGESEALKGNALFMLQEYEQAEQAYEAALRFQPDNDAWQDMRDKARRNAIARIDLHVPPLYYFSEKTSQLLQPASATSLPAPLAPRRVLWPERLRRRIGTALGVTVTLVMEVTTDLWGRLAGYKGRVWTNWYRRSLVNGILTLAYMRNRLNQDNLLNTYPEDQLTGFQPPGQEPPQGVTHFRTADGSWNNLANPKEGAAGTRFLRNVRPDAVMPETGARLLTPNPREISRNLLTRPEREIPTVPFLNLLAATWIQFENHDWINHGEILEPPDVHAIPLGQDDPARKKYHQESIFVGKTQPDPTRVLRGEPDRVTFINEVTHWWDGSQIYGSDQETQNKLRNFVDGKMRVTDAHTLPLDENGIEQTGFQRNWWIGLTIMHTLFVREHNSICDHLKVSYPHWDDNRLFNVARLINAAVMAKIHTIEWTPAILPNPGLNTALNANWFGILTNIWEYGDDRKTLSEIKIKNPEMGGVVGNPINKHGSPYGLTEEFVEVYRLHSLLPENLQLQKIGSAEKAEIPLPETRQAGSAKLTQRFTVGDILYSFGKQQPGQLVLNNFPRFMQEMSIPGNPLFDLGAVDILRARERGVPRYNEFRRQLGLNPIATFDDLTDDPAQLQKLRSVYGTNPDKVEDLDLMIGNLAESPANRPTNFGFGETMFQIFILNATRRLQADRFFTDNYNEETYTRQGLDWIDAASFKDVLIRNFPELAHTGLANVRNAFEPWDDNLELSPDRHPLRAYDPELQPNPWLGDRKRGEAKGER